MKMYKKAVYLVSFRWTVGSWLLIWWNPSISRPLPVDFKFHRSQRLSTSHSVRLGPRNSSPEYVRHITAAARPDLTGSKAHPSTPLFVQQGKGKPAFCSPSFPPSDLGGFISKARRSAQFCFLVEICQPLRSPSSKLRQELCHKEPMDSRTHRWMTPQRWMP